LNDRYNASLSDPDILSLNPEIALVTSRIVENVALLKADVDPHAFADATDSLIAGMKASDQDQIREALNRLHDLRTGVYDDDRTWNRILKLIERRRKLVDSQRRRAAEAMLSMPREHALRIVGALIDACRRNIRDSATVRAITAELRLVLGDVSLPDTEDSIH